MSKYPFVILFRYNKYSIIDDYINNHVDHYNCTFINIKSNQDDILKLFNENYNILLTVGPSEYNEYKFIDNIIPERFKHKWFHKTIEDIKNINDINLLFNHNFILNIIKPRIQTRPIFSIFTTCYNSYEFIKVAYDSIKTQTLIDWEWVILDDSTKDDHFEYLKQIFKDDYKVRLYKRHQNSGNIGNVKNEVISLCRGKYLLEMDHDDIIINTCLMDATNIFEKDSDVGFIYADTIPLYRNFNPFSYGKNIGKGYGSEYKFFYNGNWINSYLTPNINNITLSHLVCCPNHPRMWRSETLNRLENYSEYLPICDDYEILLRTCLNCKVVKINKPLYIQFTNENGNNFSTIRNKEINRIGPKFIYPMFYNYYNVNEKCKELNGYENESFIDSREPIWKRTNYQHNRLNKLVNYDINHQVCIINYNIYNDNIKELYQKDKYELYFLTNIFSDEECEEILNSLEFFNIKFISHNDCTDEQLINFFNYLLKNDNCVDSIINNNSKYLLDNNILNNIVQYNIINDSIINNNYKSYCEIGIESGFTFKKINIDNKIGIDPDPSFISDQIKCVSSNDFFQNINSSITFDIFYIDGMHQVEYIYKDFFNCLNILNENGSIFIDVILPLKEREQFKVPIKHIYEKGILKYKEPWTGDVWKFIYFILQNFKFNFKLFNNKQLFRGLIQLNNIQNPDDNYLDNYIDNIKIINDYDYKTDYPNYINLLKTYN